MKQQTIAKQQGFTLIELVMVIVILGILSATALPKFVNLGSDARKVAIQAVEGSMRATNSIIYAKAALANALGASGTPTVNGVSISTVYGFATNVTNLVAVMDISTSDFDTSTTTNVIFHKGAADGGTACRVTYAPATATTAPTYTTLNTGC
ncbi:type II secretion system protein [Candidatus Methylobacter oryzae]|uniref:Type II secretion system protein n=1 Tax=Candidatus Methylobacter oryzae TaxID=2497749 RepID=A0ABY3C9K6_9GAMM|nr:type II secretion system protein [Candidatus Methylobacter oryzae]TRW94325.1 type II secretion system protein [Candidatus Methylobacter oryzae]